MLMEPISWATGEDVKKGQEQRTDHSGHRDHSQPDLISLGVHIRHSNRGPTQTSGQDWCCWGIRTNYRR